MDSFELQAIPQTLQWEIAPREWSVSELGVLTIAADGHTDLFKNPDGSDPVNNSPRALFVPQGDFLLSASVEVDFRSAFDAGVLMIYKNSDVWAKLCFEYSPQAHPMIVSVVTRGRSDDCNSVPIDGNQIYLRIAQTGQTFAFHFSQDGQFWHMVRYFTLGDVQTLRIGFSSQSPTGEGCTAQFSDIVYAHETLQDIRSGV